MENRMRTIRLLAILFLSAFSVNATQHQAPRTGSDQPPMKQTITLELLKNILYRGIYEQPVRLTESYYEGEPFEQGAASRPTVRLIEQPIAFGDLNGDGHDDAAVLLLEQSGGSGSFLYVAAVIDQQPQPVNVATTLIGDRAQLRSMRIQGGRIIVETITQGPDDPMPFPALKLRTRYHLLGSQLVKDAGEALGPLTAEDLEGTGWHLEKMGNDQPLAPGTEISAEFADGRVTGSAGCNHYSAVVADKSRATLAVGPVTRTRKACSEPVMKQEAEYLARLEQVARFGFYFGQLRLDYKIGGKDASMFFKPLVPAFENVAVTRRLSENRLIYWRTRLIGQIFRSCSLNIPNIRLK